jgi:hypothetical protein
MTVCVVLSIYFDIQPLLADLYACTELQKTKSLLRNSCRLQLAIPLIFSYMDACILRHGN